MKHLIKDMDAVNSRFDSYDFDADQRFQDGLKTLKSGDEAKLLDMKLFFYNRSVFIGYFCDRWTNSIHIPLALHFGELFIVVSSV